MAIILHFNRDFVSDFDQMLAKKKEDQGKRRRRKDVETINDNDDLIVALIQKMKTAAEVSFLPRNNLYKEELINLIFLINSLEFP